MSEIVNGSTTPYFTRVSMMIAEKVAGAGAGYGVICPFCWVNLTASVARIWEDSHTDLDLVTLYARAGITEPIVVFALCSTDAIRAEQKFESPISEATEVTSKIRELADEAGTPLEDGFFVVLNLPTLRIVEGDDIMRTWAVPI